jgi:hypothetical protein
VSGPSSEVAGDVARLRSRSREGVFSLLQRFDCARNIWNLVKKLGGFFDGSKSRMWLAERDLCHKGSVRGGRVIVFYLPLFLHGGKEPIWGVRECGVRSAECGRLRLRAVSIVAVSLRSAERAPKL